MKISAAKESAKISADGIVIPAWGSGGKNKPGFAPKWAEEFVFDGEFEAKEGQMAIIRIPRKMAGAGGAPDCSKALLLGLGEPAKAKKSRICALYASAFNALKAGRCQTIALMMPKKEGMRHPIEDIAARVATQVVMADYVFDKYKPADKDAKKPEAKEAIIAVPASIFLQAKKRIAQGVAIGDAANFARSLQNEPSNVATPQYVADQARLAAKACGLSIKVLSRKEMKQEKMNAMLAVAQGSSEEPKLVVLEYRGDASKKGWDLCIVGKGVTFDSGGISIKPSQKMDEMKFDKSGACAAIAALGACKKIGIRKNVVGIAALVENMPGGSAYKPGDIVKACDGTTIEILNTDAEGRVVLADAIAYANSKYKPKEIIDMATLTGACVVALGDLASGVLSEDDSLASSLIGAGEECSERLWRLPLWPEYDEKVKSEIAAIKNIGESGSAGATAGASFLKGFAAGAKWAHIDIAGTAYSSKPRDGLCPGGTGFGVRLMLEYMRRK